MKRQTIQTGLDKPGLRSKATPHLGQLLLEKYSAKGQFVTGEDDLECFDLIDNLQKPVLSFAFRSEPETLRDLDRFLGGFSYAYYTVSNDEPDEDEPDLEIDDDDIIRGVTVFISRFPQLIRFIAEHGGVIPDDLWGLLYGYPLPEVHQFTYDYEAWRRSDL